MQRRPIIRPCTRDVNETLENYQVFASARSQYSILCLFVCRTDLTVVLSVLWDCAYCTFTPQVMGNYY